MHIQKINWHVFDSNEALTQAAVDAIAQSAAEAIATRGRFLIALSGGKTPGTVFQMLRQVHTDWSKWHIYFSDERCLPPDDEERNSLMAARALLDHVPIPPEQIHYMPAELGAVEGAAAYSATLEGVGTFDLVQLGIGEDGHTASLFPGHSWEHNPPTPAISVKHSPKPPSDRISLSASRLSDTRRVLFLVTGASKQHAVSQWRGNANMPVKAIASLDGIDVFMDAAANEAP